MLNFKCTEQQVSCTEITNHNMNESVTATKEGRNNTVSMFPSNSHRTLAKKMLDVELNEINR